MKKLILLLLFSALSFGQTRSAMQTQIDAIATGVPNTALKVRTILNTLANGTAQTGDIKEIDVSTSYIAANFDVTGLGTNERLGWAICNGNNGTRNRSGRVSLAYDAINYPTLGATGGNSNITLTKNNIPALDLTINVSNSDNSGGDHHLINATNVEDAGAKTYLGVVNSSTTGSSIDVRQPYIVTLVIMKL